MKSPYGPSSANQTPKTPPPPNYSSRGVQLRLMMLVAAFMLVVVIMERVRDPNLAFYRFFTQEEPYSDLQNAPAEPIDTRPPRTPEIFSGDPLGTIRTVSPIHKLPSRLDSTREDSLQTALLDAWSRMLSRLSSADRQILLKTLKTARDGGICSRDDHGGMATVIDHFTAGWSEYLKLARSSLENDDANLSAEQIKAWQKLVTQLENHWTLEVKPALDVVFEDRSWKSDEAQVLEKLQSLLHQNALAQIEDNTLLGRGVENAAWFRLLDTLNTSPQTEIQSRSTGHVNFIQLFKQPQEYRGRLVTVRGRAKLAYFLQAPENVYGISGYYVFWINPAGGPNSPIVVYSLDLPKQFPAITGGNPLQDRTPLDENVEFTGYFFKRYAYRSEGGRNTAPLLLAKVPDWSPPRPFKSEPLPSMHFLLLGIVGVAMLSGLLAYIAYARTRGPSTTAQRLAAAVQKAPDRLEVLAEIEPVNVHDELRQLGHDQQ